MSWLLYGQMYYKKAKNKWTRKKTVFFIYILFILCPKRRIKVIATKTSQFIKLKMASEEQHKPGAMKKKIYKVKCLKDWAKSFLSGKVNETPYAIYCMVYKKSVCFHHMEIADVKEHCNRTVQKMNQEAIKTTRKITSFVESEPSS